MKYFLSRGPLRGDSLLRQKLVIKPDEIGHKYAGTCENATIFPIPPEFGPQTLVFATERSITLRTKGSPGLGAENAGMARTAPISEEFTGPRQGPGARLASMWGEMGGTFV